MLSISESAETIRRIKAWRGGGTGADFLYYRREMTRNAGAQE